MPKIERRRALPTLPRSPRCPAAVIVEGALPERAGIVCAVVANDRKREDGVGITAGQLAIAREGGDGDVFLSIATDPSTVKNLCCGDAIPVLHEHEHPGGRDSYTYCPVWQAEKWRIEQGNDQLGRPIEPEAVSHGVSTLEADDPWAQARRDAELFEAGS